MITIGKERINQMKYFNLMLAKICYRLLTTCGSSYGVRKIFAIYHRPPNYPFPELVTKYWSLGDFIICSR